MTDTFSEFVPTPVLARPDLAALALEGIVRADAYRATEAMRCAAPVADIHAEASTASERIDQLLHGEIFDVLERRGGRAWGQARRDGTVGWIDVEPLGPATGLPTHRVSDVGGDLPLNALVRGDGPGRVEIGAFEDDPVTVAERLLGTPHSVGARSSFATDCSGMVQQALFACGRACARHSAAQSRLGEPVTLDDARRGDIVVWLNVRADQSWTGHSAFMLDASRVIHATGFHGAVVVEAFAEADARYVADGFEQAVFRRLP